MESMTVTRERVERAGMTAAPAKATGARMRDLTPAQRRAVMFAQQQVIKARAAKKAKEERQAALERMWQQEDFAERTRGHTGRAVEAAPEAKEVSLREAIGHVLRDLRTRDHKTLREVSEKAGVSLGVPVRGRTRAEGGQLGAAGVDRPVAGRQALADAAAGGRLPGLVGGLKDRGFGISLR
ncbi:transcriptional regulator [Bifidobacterium pullorum]|uniref:Transcriptional regulator n=1 Tax=Bifidobacterium pullorum TaxID=78448 RepID=A0A7V8HS43_9BIFI|nr:transcriptional regulator [Bifidobacterium pullorum]